MSTLTHQQVSSRFKSDLTGLCKKHNIQITSDSDIFVQIEPVYDKTSNLYLEFGAEFSLGKSFNAHTTESTIPSNYTDAYC